MGDPKYVYHLCDDTTHDPSLVHLVLENIFDTQDFENEAVIIKSENAPTQYKNRYAIKSMHLLAISTILPLLAFMIQLDMVKASLPPCPALLLNPFYDVISLPLTNGLVIVGKS